MTFSEYRETYSWQNAIEIGPKLMRLAEELPAAEENGLSLHLRQLMIEVPAGIAADLLKGADAQLGCALKLVTVLEMIDQVYPALDTADTNNAADALLQRLASPSFAERQGGPSLSPALQEPAPEREAPTPAPADTPLLPAAAPAELASPESVTVQSALAPAAPPTTISVAVEAAAPVTPGSASLVEESDVHTNSVQ